MITIQESEKHAMGLWGRVYALQFHMYVDGALEESRRTQMDHLDVDLLASLASEDADIAVEEFRKRTTRPAPQAPPVPRDNYEAPKPTREQLVEAANAIFK